MQPFPTEELRSRSYEKKRHQGGRAFECAGLASTNYSFVRGRHLREVDAQGSADRPVMARLADLQWPPWLWEWPEARRHEAALASFTAVVPELLPCPHCDRCALI